LGIIDFILQAMPMNTWKTYRCRFSSVLLIWNQCCRIEKVQAILLVFFAFSEYFFNIESYVLHFYVKQSAFDLI